MGSLLYLTLTLLSLAFTLTLTTQAQGIKSSRLLDLVLRDNTFRYYNTKKFKTAKLYPIQLPSNLSGIKVDSIRYRCGSLARYGAKIKEFSLPIGVSIQHCAERVLIIRQNLGSNWSSIYYDNYELSGYQLVSPVLALLVYNAGDDIATSSNIPFELKFLSDKSPITIDFSNTTRVVNSSPGIIPLCASFERDGKVILTKQVSQNVCSASKQGHFGLVIESPLIPLKNKRESKWKLAIGSSIGAALGAFLLGLLLIAIFAKVKKKARMEELVRRAYEEEALQVSMVGHVRAPIAAGTRTVPTIEHEYSHHNTS
ncbi:hypothetical protein KY290_034794 [Solanum tuberosum]|uniref:Uncharacterized protein n=1 Tax=Solanum tuberosum TaxID=4113 RepID=A0ABQ7U5X7_SOLTU|nr:hypothetical protein KY289_034954 [Solanum tuberosum]KAH0741751.1 hypothetical protein KY290_034794 [Solanum tuberosum]